MANISQEVDIELLEKKSDGSYIKKNPATKASQVRVQDNQNNFTNKTVEGAMGELFTNVSNGKQLVGNAITGVDDSVVVPTEPSFGDLASAIGGISTGKKWASGTSNLTTANYNHTINVTDLPFKPSLVMVVTTYVGVSHLKTFKIWSSIPPFNLANNYFMNISLASGVTSETQQDTSFKVTDNGFNGVVAKSNTSEKATWIAFE